MNKKKIVEKLTELQKHVMWLQKESDGTKSGIFYWEQLGPIYRIITSLKENIKKEIK